MGEYYFLNLFNAFYLTDLIFLQLFYLRHLFVGSVSRPKLTFTGVADLLCGHVSLSRQPRCLGKVKRPVYLSS